MVLNLPERYRPKSLTEVIGQDYAVRVVSGLIEKYKNGEITTIPSMLFYGQQGTGKTTMAYVLYYELKKLIPDIGITEFNASIERGVKFVEETLAPMIRQAGRRIILLDEADYMTPNAQGMLRRLLEKAEQIAIRSNGRNMTIVILTANYLSRIIPPIRSRLVNIPFKPIPKEVMLNRLMEITISEAERGMLKVETDEDYKLLADALTLIVENARGDMRRALRMLESVILASKGGKITPEVVLKTIEPELPVKIIRTVLFQGDYVKAREMLYEGLINGKFTEQEFIELAYQELTELIGKKIDNLSKDELSVITGLLLELKDIERNILIGASPVVQLGSFLGALLLARTQIRW